MTDASWLSGVMPQGPEAETLRECEMVLRARPIAS